MLSQSWSHWRSKYKKNIFSLSTSANPEAEENGWSTSWIRGNIRKSILDATDCCRLATNTAASSIVKSLLLQHVRSKIIFIHRKKQRPSHDNHHMSYAVECILLFNIWLEFFGVGSRPWPCQAVARRERVFGGLFLTILKMVPDCIQCIVCALASANESKSGTKNKMKSGSRLHFLAGRRIFALVCLATGHDTIRATRYSITAVEWEFQIVLKIICIRNVFFKFLSNYFAPEFLKL